MKRHISAGGIVINTKTDPPTILISQHSGHKGWGFPKGHIEKGEEPEETAVREVEEETGIKAAVLEKAGHVKYVYTQDNERHFKIVTFYLMKARSTTLKLSWEMQDAAWVPFDAVRNKLTFSSEKKLWDDVESRVSDLVQSN